MIGCRDCELLAGSRDAVETACVAAATDAELGFAGLSVEGGFRAVLLTLGEDGTAVDGTGLDAGAVLASLPSSTIPWPKLYVNPDGAKLPGTSISPVAGTISSPVLGCTK